MNMSRTLDRIKNLVSKGKIRVSDHGYDEIAADGLFVRDLVEGLPAAESLEEYPDFPKGPSVLVLEYDRDKRPVHAVWGIPRGEDSPAVLVTAYRPDPAKWTDDCRRRK